MLHEISPKHIEYEVFAIYSLRSFREVEKITHFHGGVWGGVGLDDSHRLLKGLEEEQRTHPCTVKGQFARYLA